MSGAFVSIDRRGARRWSAAGAHAVIAVRIRPGRAAIAIDVSSSGVLIETPHRLMPGFLVDVHVETSAGPQHLRGRILRCTVAELRPGGICYRGAIAFDRALRFSDADDGYAIPTVDLPPAATVWARDTPDRR
jgi:hypothetical protein